MFHLPHSHIPRLLCPTTWSKYQKGHVRNEHQHVRSAGGSSDNVSGLKFPDSPSCATISVFYLLLLLKLLAKTFAVVVAVVAAAVTCVASVCVCLCVWGVRAHWCCSRSMCSRRDASGSSSRLLHFGAQLLLLLLLLQVQFA